MILLTAVAYVMRMYRASIFVLGFIKEWLQLVYLCIRHPILSLKPYVQELYGLWLSLPKKTVKFKYNTKALSSHFSKKYLFTINHKRIALNYMYFSMFSGLAGSMLASFIRLELAYPGSHFFKGDSIRYIQVISAHGLVMIFYVVVPIIFGLFANYFIPYHIMSKDVAFPRLNSIGFWLLPAGFILMAKPAFTRRQVYKHWDPYDAYVSTRKDILKRLKDSIDPSVLNYDTSLHVKHEVPNYIKIMCVLHKQDRNSYLYIQTFEKPKLFIKYLWKLMFMDDFNKHLLNGYFINLKKKTSNYYRSDMARYPTCILTNDSFLSRYKLSPLDVSSRYKWKLMFRFTNNKLFTFNKKIREFVNIPSCDINHVYLSFFKKSAAKLKTFKRMYNSVEVQSDIQIKLADTYWKLQGRVISPDGKDISIPKGWTKFLMLWEYNYKWYENPWLSLRHAFKTKSVLMKNERCSSPTSVMAGWAFITPFSSKTRFTGFGAQDAAAISVLFAGLSTTISFTNLLITRRVLAAPGFKNRKNSIPFISISLFLVMRMLALITPVLGAAMLMLLMDRHWETSFFDYSYGGDAILFHHLFWFFGHPEVYVIIIPAFGIINSFLPFYNRRRIASKNHLVWATYVMAYMGFLVWGHHMYLVGLDHRSRSFYSTITVMISLPAVVKIANWTLTFLNGSTNFDIPLFFVLAFFSFFLSGGLTGLWLSHIALNWYVHDTFYVVAHFHFMFSCATFSALFAGFYFYYKEFFGVEYSKVFATAHLIYWFFGQWVTFMPLYWVGYNGLPRRYHDYPVMYMGWHGLSTAGHLLTMLSICFFFLGILESKFRKKGYISSTYGIPRYFKRVQYFLFKIINQKSGSKLSKTPRFCN